MYQILLSKAAARDIDKIDKKYKPHIFASLFDLRKDPYLGKKLKGKFRDCYSLRVGSYRIIYKIYKRQLNILVIRIGHRQGIYR
mgnify:CR=1 FL=1